MMKSLVFKLKFAFRNALKNKGRFFVVVLSFIITVMLSVMIFGMRNYLYDIFTLEFQEQYQDVDLIVTYDNYSSSRIVNARTIKEQYATYFSFVSTFFNLNGLILVHDEFVDVNIYSSTVGEFENVIDYDVGSLNPMEVMVTKSFADAYDININDTISLYINNEIIHYKVKEIVNDKGLFVGNSIFVNKEELFEATVWSSSPNLGNVIYLNVKEQHTLSDVIEVLKSDANYQDNFIYEAVDLEKVDVRAKYNASIMLGLIVIVMLAMIMVIKSIFPLLFRDFSSQIGVIKILGGNDHFAFQIWLYQFLFYFLVSIPIGLIGANIMMNLGARAFEIHSWISLKWISLIASVFLFVVIMLWLIVTQYHKLTKKSEIFLSSNKQSEKQSSDLYLLFMLGGALFINIIFAPLPKYKPFFSLVLVIVFSFVFVSQILRWLPRFVKKKHTFFSIYSIPYLRDNKVMHNSLKVIFISLVVLAVSLSISSLYKQGQQKAIAEVHIDLLLTNIYDYDSALKNNITAKYGTNQISDGSIYENITMDFAQEESRLIKFVLSLHPDEIKHFFSYSIEEDVLAKLDDMDTLYVILPYQYEKIGKVKTGDKITLHISKDLPSEQFIVAGFFENYSDGLLFTNLHVNNKYVPNSMVNTLFINSEDVGLHQDLVREYSNKMYYAIDAKTLFLNEAKKLLQVADFFSFVIWILIGCFVLVIMNNSLLVFYSLKNDYAKMKILGCKNHVLFFHIFCEIIIVLIVAFIASFINVMIVFSLFPSLLIMVGFYFQYSYQIGDVLWYLLIGNLVFFTSYVYYFLKIRNMNVIQESINL